MWCSDEALRPLVGCKAPHRRQGRCQRGATPRQGERSPGPISVETWANHRVTLHMRDRERVFKGAIRAVAQAGLCGQQVTGRAEGTDVETTERDRGGGQVTRPVRIADQPGRVHASEVTVEGGNVRRLLEAITKRPWAVKGAKLPAPEALWTRAVVPQARMHRAGVARRPQGILDQGLWDGTPRWWRAQPAVPCVVPAHAQMAVTAAARAPAAAGAAMTGGRRAHPGRHGPGQTARPERRETAVVGSTGLTPDDQDGTPAQARQVHRRDVQPHPRPAGVVRKWPGKDEGPGGNTVLLTKASADTPVPVSDDDDDRRLSEHGWTKACQPPWDEGHPPYKTARAVQVPVLFTRRMVALATAYRLPCEREATGGEVVGWPLGRRQLLEQTREQGMVLAQGVEAIVHRAEDALLGGVKRKHQPPGMGTR